MICVKILGGVGIAICLIAACSPSTTIIPLVTETTPADSDEPAPLPLSEPGSYGVGMRKYTITDPGRDDREVEISVWFPAVKPTEVDPDPRAAPYPLILSSTKAAFVFAPSLVSHGFTWVSVDNID